MAPNERIHNQTFDIVRVTNESFLAEHAEVAADMMSDLGQCAMRFARIERVPRYDHETRENDAEHSFMLALVATEVAQQYYPDMDPGLIARFSLVHDLVELETGDVATFSISEADLAIKEAAEHLALEKVSKRLAPYTGALLLRYESQNETEAKFVRFVDKLLPIVVDIYGAGAKILHEDYDVHTQEQLGKAEAELAERCFKRFPQPEFDFIHAIRAVLSGRLIEKFDTDCSNC